MRRAARRDSNHAAIGAELRARGYAVTDLGHVGRGVPDLFVSRNGRGVWLEIKNPAARPGRKRGANQAATDAREAAFREAHAGCCLLVTSAADVDAAWPA